MKALAITTTAKTVQSKKAKITYISSFKKRNKVKPYAKFDLDWQDILRANNPEKRLSEASVMLSARLAYELHRNNERPVFLTSHWFEKTTKKMRHQNARLRNQIDHIFNFKFYPRKFHDGEMLFNVHEVCWTSESHKILNLEDIVIEQETSSKPQVNKLQACSTNAPGVEHKSYSYIEDKEIINPLKRGLFISDNEKLKIKRKVIEKEIIPEKSIEQTQPLEKPSLSDDFQAPTENEASNINEQDAREVTNEAEVVRGVFTHCEPLERLVEPDKAPMESSIALHQAPPIPSQQIIKKTETEQMAKPEKQQQQQEQQQQEDLKQTLSYEIQKCFNAQQSAELQENLEVRTLAPDKVGLKFRTKIDLNESNKARLRECIRTVYGHAIKIIRMPDFRVVETSIKLEIPDKPQMPTAEESARRGIKEVTCSTPAGSKWDAVKNYVLGTVYENIADGIKITLDQVSVVGLTGRKLKLRAGNLVCEKLVNHQSTLEKSAAKYDVDIELENTMDKDILYFPWTYASKDLPPLTLDNLKK